MGEDIKFDCICSFLGHPIVNDHLYNPTCKQRTLSYDLVKKKEGEQGGGGGGEGEVGGSKGGREGKMGQGDEEEGKGKKKEEEETKEKGGDEEKKPFFDEVCPICRGDDQVRDVSDEYLCLHGWRYRGPAWTFMTKEFPWWVTTK